MKKVVFFFFVCFISLRAQNNEFDTLKYRQYINDHKDMNSGALLGLYPAGVFKSNIHENFNIARFSDSIQIKYGLTDAEKTLINKNGFVVSDRLSFSSYGEAFLDIYHKDLPAFISCDAILHAFHKSYDRILENLEHSVIVPELNNILEKFSKTFSALDSKYASIEGMRESLKDIDLYLSVGRSLMGNTVTLNYPENKRLYDEIMNNIKDEFPRDISLFCITPRTYDFSQFKLRGHYANSHWTDVRNYFKTMMWFGRTEFYLIAPQTANRKFTTEDVRRQIIDAVLINEMIDSSNTLALIKNIDDMIKLFIGESDNVTIWNLQELITQCNIKSADELLQAGKMESFQDVLRTKAYASQRILSQILMGDPLSPEKIQPASSFLLLGQRFILDSYVTSQVVYDRIIYQNQKITRMLPSTLDILFALGNDAALQLLKPELEQYKYSSNLDALRYLIDSYGNDFWDISIYNAWLNSIRAMNPPVKRDNLPAYMQTAAYWQEKINSQLTSWTELRHDNLLYGKQSYTGGVICSFPYAYVEPITSFYEKMKILTETAKRSITNSNLPETREKQNVIRYFERFYNICDTLRGISEKELGNKHLDQKEINFMKNIIYEGPQGCAPSYSGWYSNLFYSDSQGKEGLLLKDYLVADIHTSPTDEAGIEVGWVKHCGTGEINMGVFLSTNSDGNKCAFIGPVGSYYEYTSTNFKRLDDEEWNSTGLWKSLRPSFTNMYMTDTLGNAISAGSSLLTGINDKIEVKKNDLSLSRNYPNPFNPATNIIYQIPLNYHKSLVSIVVYDLNGREVKTLFKNELPSGNYITRWDGKNESGITAPSGAYFYTLKVGDYSETKRMILIK